MQGDKEQNPSGRPDMLTAEGIRQAKSDHEAREEAFWRVRDNITDAIYEATNPGAEMGEWSDPTIWHELRGVLDHFEDRALPLIRSPFDVVKEVSFDIIHSAADKASMRGHSRVAQEILGVGEYYLSRVRPEVLEAGVLPEYIANLARRFSSQA